MDLGSMDPPFGGLSPFWGSMNPVQKGGPWTPGPCFVLTRLNRELCRVSLIGCCLVLNFRAQEQPIRYLVDPDLHTRYEGGWGRGAQSKKVGPGLKVPGIGESELTCTVPCTPRLWFLPLCAYWWFASIL